MNYNENQYHFLTKEYSIPVDFIKTILSLRKSEQLRLFIYLKAIANDKGIVYTYQLQSAHKTINYSEKTLRNHLKWLENKNWIGKNKSNKLIHLRSFKYLFNKYYVNSRTSLSIHYYDLKDKKKFKGMLFGSLITSLINQQKKIVKNGNGNLGELQKHGSFQTSHFLNHEFGLSNSLLASYIEMSTMQACNYKHLAEHHGFITTKSNCVLINKMSDRAFREFRSVYKEESKPLRRFQGFTFCQNYDLIEPNMTLKSRCLNW